MVPGKSEGFACLIMAGVIGAQAPAPDEVARFRDEVHTVWLGRSTVIPFELPEPQGEELRPELVLDERHLELVRPAIALAGETRGYLRVLGVGEGETSIRMGSSVTRVRVRPTPTEGFLLEPELLVTSPVDGAALWGTVHAGVELRGLVLDPAALEGELRLELSNGEVLAPIAKPAAAGPDRRASFALETDALDEGLLYLRALLVREGVPPLESPRVAVEVVRPTAEGRLEVECEELVGRDVPEGFSRGRPSLGRGASGGTYTIHSRPGRPLVAPIRVHEPGRYQLTVVARGNLGAGSFPSIGFARGRERDLFCTGAVFDQSWRRIAIGPVITLDAGDHDFGLVLLNASSLADTNERSLHLDRFELLRIDARVGRYGEEGPPAWLRAEAFLSRASLMSGGLARGSADRIEAAVGRDRVQHGSGGLTIGLDRPLDGRNVTGRVNLHAVCRWDEGTNVESGVPRTELVLNERVVMTQEASRPHFALDRASFEEGANRLFLRSALPDGRRAATPVQTVYVERRLEKPVRDHHAFEVLDSRWDPAIEPWLERGSGNQEIAHLPSGRELRLHLPEGLEGDFHVLFQARGPKRSEGRLRFAIEEEVEGEVRAQKARVAKTRPYFSHVEGGRVSLGSGTKSLVLERVDGGKERDLQLVSVILRRRGRGDGEPPVARLLYPEPGHRSDEVDACIVEGWDDDAIARADVWIDGRPQGTFGFVPQGAGFCVLPLLTKGLAPGEHTLSCRLQDPGGNVAETREITIRVGERDADDPGPYARAIRLLNRFAYGPDPFELAKCLVLGEQAWLRRSFGPIGVGERTALGAAEARLRNDSPGSVSRAALAQALRTDNPVRTRLCFWIENHFSTWIEKTRGAPKWSEHKRFLALGAAPFVELLWASVTSPAMIHYLDQSQSHGSRLNENYARELLELHSLGVDGGYGQSDVTELASLLAGLTLSVEALSSGQGGDLRDAVHRVLRFDPTLGDARARRLLGMRFEEASVPERFDRLRLIVELLSAHPATARFVSTKLVEHYVAVPAPAGMVDELTRVFTETGGELGELVIAIARHPDFHREGRGRVATPLDFGLRLGRTLDTPDVDSTLHGFLERSGMGVFRRETPDGYPAADESWVGANAWIQRRALTEDLAAPLRRAIPSALTRTPVGDPREWHERLVDVASVRLFGWTLEGESRSAALAFCEGIELPRDVPRELPRFLAQLPETSTR